MTLSLKLSTLFFIYVSAVFATGFTCTRPTSHTGYNAPTSDPSSLSTTASPFNNGTVTSGTDNFTAVCATGYHGTVSASCRTISNEAYRLSGCTNCGAGKHTAEFDPSWTAVDIATSADGAQSVFVADMDGDGDMDIVSASYKDDTIAWYENNGTANCITCQPGTYQDEVGQNTCKSCTAGFYQYVAGQTECVASPCSYADNLIGCNGADLVGIKQFYKDHILKPC